MKYNDVLACCEGKILSNILEVYKFQVLITKQDKQDFMNLLNAVGKVKLDSLDAVNKQLEVKEKEYVVVQKRMNKYGRWYTAWILYPAEHVYNSNSENEPKAESKAWGEPTHIEMRSGTKDDPHTIIFV